MNILTWIEALKGGAIGLETDRASPTRAEKRRAGPGGPNAHPWLKISQNFVLVSEMTSVSFYDYLFSQKLDQK